MFQTGEIFWVSNFYNDTVDFTSLIRNKEHFIFCPHFRLTFMTMHINRKMLSTLASESLQSLFFYVCSNRLLVPTKNLIKSIPSLPLSPKFPGLKTSHVNFPPGLSSFGEFALLLFSLQQFPASALSANGRVTTFLDLFSLPQHLKRRICAHRLILNVIVMFVVGALRLLLSFS